MNEGFLAVEQLFGASLLYHRHLRRSVLCGRGLCATNNQGLVVDGVYTSMRNNATRPTR